MKTVEDGKIYTQFKIKFENSTKKVYGIWCEPSKLNDYNVSYEFLKHKVKPDEEQCNECYIIWFFKYCNYTLKCDIPNLNDIICEEKGMILYFKDLLIDKQDSFIKFINNKYGDALQCNEFKILREKENYLYTYLESLGYMIHIRGEMTDLNFKFIILNKILNKWDTTKWTKEFKIDKYHVHSFNTDNSHIKTLFLDTFYRKHNGEVVIKGDLMKYYDGMKKFMKKNDGISSWQVTEEINIIKPLFEANFKYENNDVVLDEEADLDNYIITVEKLYSINTLLPLVVGEWQLTRYPYNY